MSNEQVKDYLLTALYPYSNHSLGRFVPHTQGELSLASAVLLWMVQPGPLPGPVPTGAIQLAMSSGSGKLAPFRSLWLVSVVHVPTGTLA